MTELSVIQILLLVFVSIRLWEWIKVSSIPKPSEELKQEFWLHFDHDVQGNYMYFDHNVSNLKQYKTLLQLVKKTCARGNWMAYESPNFQSPIFLISSKKTGEINCKTMDVSSIKSLRHLGASNISTDAISLYSGVHWTGEEILILGEEFIEIEIPILSFAKTGTSDWRLFEGKHLNGKTICTDSLNATELVYGWESDVRRATLNFTTIGSGFKGCYE